MSFFWVLRPAGGPARPDASTTGWTTASGNFNSTADGSAPVPRIAVVACAIVAAVLVSGGGHHVVFALAPLLVVSLLV